MAHLLDNTVDANVFCPMGSFIKPLKYLSVDREMHNLKTKPQLFAPLLLAWVIASQASGEVFSEVALRFGSSGDASAH